ncbi:MAG: helix-turn-helix domain-containing protein, partial [Ginsengibacter sp.]
INDPAFRTIMAIRTFFHKPKIKNEISAFNYYKDNVIKLLKLHDGAIVKQKEDYFLVSFKSVSSAIKSAFEIFSSFKGLRDKVFKENTFLKIGLSAGVPVTEKKLFFEDTIKLAERICTSIKGEIIISSEVWELYNNENSTPLPEGAYISTLTETDENFLNLLMDFIESRWNDTNLKVVDLTRPSGCSKSQLYRKMVFLTGKSPNAFIKELRLDRSLGLLNKNNRNISQIAYESGFTSPSYFSKCFQKRFGFSPSEYFLPQ